VFLLGVLVQLPTLGVGFFADDYVHQLALEDESGLVPMPRWNLYDFRSAGDWEAFGQERGAFPWWTSADWKVRFFRPLTSLSLWLDHALFADWAPGYHATSFFLWIALLLLVHRLFLALELPPRAALLGLLLFVLSDASSVPVGWIANRNSLLEALGSTAALLLVLRGRGVPGPGAIAGALAAATAAALSKESGALAFVLIAVALWMRGRSSAGPELARARAGALLALLFLAAHLAFLARAGFGTRSLFYATPWIDPGRFAGNLFLLATGGVLSLVGPFSLDLAMLFPAVRTGLVLAGVLLGWPLALWIARGARGRSGAGLLALWTVLFLLPQGGVVGADRLLFVPSIGAAGLGALFWLAERERWREHSRARRALLFALAASATLGSGAFLLLQNVALAGMASHVRTKALATEVGPRELGRRDVVVLQTESQMQAFTLGATWHVERDDPLVHFWLLQSGPRALCWTRIDERSFELESRGAPFLSGPFEQVYLSSPPPPPAGTRFETPLFAVEALESDASGLCRIRVELARSLDDPALSFVRPVEGVLTRIAPPPVGGSLELPAAVPSRPFVP